MAVVASGIYSTAYRLKLLLADSSAVQSLLEVADSTAALAKMSSYSALDLTVPRCLVTEHEITFERTDGAVWPTERQLSVWLEFYIPADASADTIEDEHNWAMTELGDVTVETLGLSGTGVPVAGTTHINLHSMTLLSAERMPEDERDDERTNLSRWIGLYTVSLM